MEDTVPFGSQVYFLMLALLLFARGMDLLSTWIATPNLVLEANPIAKKLGWKWGGVLNFVICLLTAAWPIAAVVLVTTSLLVAARNFKSAWLMRALGETGYRLWICDALAQTGVRWLLVSLLGETLLTALVGGAVMLFAGDHEPLLAIGLGVVAYAFAVTFFTLLSLWRMRRRVG